MGAPYGLELGQIQPYSRYVSSCLYTSAYSAGYKQYYLGLGGWASGSSKVMLCVTWFKCRKTGFMQIRLINSFNKAEIYGSLAPGARGVQIPFYSPSSISLASIARILPYGYNNVNQAALWDLWMVFNKEHKEYSSTWVSHNDEVPSTT